MVRVDFRENVGGSDLLAVARGGSDRDLILLTVLVPDALGKTAVEKERPRPRFLLGRIPANPLDAARYGNVLHGDVERVDKEISLGSPRVRRLGSAWFIRVLRPVPDVESK